MGIITDGIETTYQTTHRRTCDDVNGEACLLDDFQGTDMGDAFGTASAENNGNLLAFTSSYAQSCHHCQQ